MRTVRRLAGLTVMVACLGGCGVAPGAVAGPGGAPPLRPGGGTQPQGFGMAAAIRVDPSSPTTPGCQRACTQIGWVGPGPDPNTCQDICPDPAAPAPPTTSSVPPGCEEHCTASLPPQCHTVCPQPATSGTVPDRWGRGGLQAPWPADSRGGALPNPPQAAMPQVDTSNWPRYVAGQGGTVSPWGPPQRRWAPTPY